MFIFLINVWKKNVLNNYQTLSKSKMNRREDNEVSLALVAPFLSI